MWIGYVGLGMWILHLVCGLGMSDPMHLELSVAKMRVGGASDAEADVKIGEAFIEGFFGYRPQTFCSGSSPSPSGSESLSFFRPIVRI